MNNLACILCSLLVLLAAGCQPARQKPASEENLLVVEFSPEVPLRYKMISQRDIAISLGGEKDKPQTSAEQLELIISYQPLGQVNPYGLTTIQATCESATARRKTLRGGTEAKDAVTALEGKTYTFKVGPTGRIEDFSDLERVSKELGEKAFSGNSTAGNIKDPDMISDFVTLQWYLWDSVGKLASTAGPVEVGQQWQTKQLIPFASPVRGTRQTTYELTDLRQTDQGRKAIFTMSYEPAAGELENMPVPYDRGYRMRGLFGFLRNYELKSIEGSGEQIFNIDRGVVESEQQNYTMKLTASFMMPLADANPALTVDQTISIELLEDQVQ